MWLEVIITSKETVTAIDLAEIYAEIAEAIGIENTLLVFDVLKGRQISFPQRIYSKKYVEKFIKENYNGKNIRELSRKFGYTERRVKQILTGSTHTESGDVS